MLKTIPLQDQDTRYQGLVAQIELLKRAADTPEIQQLQQQVAENRRMPHWRQQLSLQLHQVGRNEEALELLFGHLRKISPPQMVGPRKDSRRSSLRWVRVMHWRRSPPAVCVVVLMFVDRHMNHNAGCDAACPASHHSSSIASPPVVARIVKLTIG